MHPVELERAVHAELRRLPVPIAPATLLPRVLAAVQQWTRRPWYERAWFTWPIGWQVISAALLVGLVGGAVVIAPAAYQLVDARIVSRIAVRATPAAAAVDSVIGQAEALATAGRILWRAVGEPLAPYVFIVVLLMGVACAAFGTVLNRVAFERT